MARGFLLKCCVCGETVAHVLADERPQFIFCRECCIEYVTTGERRGDAERTSRIEAAHQFARQVADELEAVL